jgi:hypothetical protein
MPADDSDVGWKHVPPVCPGSRQARALVQVVRREHEETMNEHLSTFRCVPEP